MARIVIIQHHTDTKECSRYSIQLLIDEWTRRGHKVMVVSGIEQLPEAELAILHVNLSVVPDAYGEAARRYPRSINAGALDIRKRTISRNLLNREDSWSGGVVIKTDLNFAGWPEWRAWKEALSLGLEAPPTHAPVRSYALYSRMDDVPAPFWDSPELIAERFLPEKEGERFITRTWFFFGDQERCRRFSSDRWLVKGATIQDAGLCDVPDLLRAERERLGFDYGKFDFVVHRGQPILLDANKTPGAPPPGPGNAILYPILANGVESLLAAPAA